MGNYEIAVLVGWAIAVWALCSVLFSDPAKFTALGRSKGQVPGPLGAGIAARIRGRGARPGSLPFPLTAVHCRPSRGCRFSGPNTRRPSWLMSSTTPSATRKSASLARLQVKTAAQLQSSNLVMLT